MIEVPLYVFLFLFFIFLAIFSAFYIMIVYHIIASASFTMVSFFVSFFVIAASLLILYTTFDFLSEVNWRQPMFSFDTRGFTGMFGL